jgi:hypothetical protein
MSYNGSGTFQINTSGQPVVTGTVISSSAFNALTADLATGLSTAITKDGQTATTVRIPFAQGINSSLATDATSTTTGSIYTAGGLGIAKALWVGGLANIAGALAVGGTATFSVAPVFSALTASSAVATDASKNLVSVTNTGTGSNVLGTAPTISLPTIDNIKMGYSTTATAAGTTTLTVASNYRQFFTGSTTQTVVLPVTSTLVTGIAYEIENNSTGTLTVNSSGGNLVGTIPSGVCAHAVCIGTTLTTAADWDWDYISTSTITGTGANVLATSPTLTSPTLASANITTALTLTGAAGTSGQLLTSGGSGAAPTWTTASGITRGTAVASTSGTSIDFTSIPSTVKRITVMFYGVSTNGVSIPIVQLGAGSVQTSGYLCTAITNGAATQFTTGFGIVRANGASSVHQGSVMLVNITGNNWVAYGVISQTDAASGGSTAGSVSLSGTLDRVRITMENGTDAFDAGTLNILYE